MRIDAQFKSDLDAGRIDDRIARALADGYLWLWIGEHNVYDALIS